MALACVQGSTNGTNGIPISFKVLPMVQLVIPLLPMVMPMVSLALPMVPLLPMVSQSYHWLPMVPLVKFPMVPLGEPRTHALKRGTETVHRVRCNRRSMFVHRIQGPWKHPKPPKPDRSTIRFVVFPRIATTCEYEILLSCRFISVCQRSKAIKIA